MWHFVLSALNWYIYIFVFDGKTAIIMLKLLGTTTQNFAARVNRCPEFVHSCKCALYIENGFWCSWQFNWSQLITNTDSQVQTSSIHHSVFTVWLYEVVSVAKTVQWLTKSWMVQCSNSGGDEIFNICPDQPRVSWKMRTVSVLGVMRLGCGNYQPPSSSTGLVNTKLYIPVNCYRARCKVSLHLCSVCITWVWYSSTIFTHGVVQGMINKRPDCCNKSFMLIDTAYSSLSPSK